MTVKAPSPNHWAATKFSIFNFLRNFHTDFHKCSILHSCQQDTRIPISPQPHQYLLFSAFLISLGGSDGKESGWSHLSGCRGLNMFYLHLILRKSVEIQTMIIIPSLRKKKTKPWAAGKWHQNSNLDLPTTSLFQWGLVETKMPQTIQLLPKVPLLPFLGPFPPLPLPGLLPSCMNSPADPGPEF